VTAELTRRAALCTLVGGSCALALGCGGEEDTAPSEGLGACVPGPRDGSAGWVEVPLADHPALRTVGGSAAVERPEAFLNAVVFHSSEGCYGAVWSVCTHGACTVEYKPDAHRLECPCHGSRFSEEGTVLRGPAARPLFAYDVAREGDSLFLRRRR
jgi:cytochrome b6-f complex iron-sulfur subunit